jgi:hypothetical protein
VLVHCTLLRAGIKTLGDSLAACVSTAWVDMPPITKVAAYMTAILGVLLLMRPRDPEGSASQPSDRGVVDILPSASQRPKDLASMDKDPMLPQIPTMDAEWSAAGGRGVSKSPPPRLPGARRVRVSAGMPEVHSGAGLVTAAPPCLCVCVCYQHSTAQPSGSLRIEQPQQLQSSVTDLNANTLTPMHSLHMLCDLADSAGGLASEDWWSPTPSPTPMTVTAASSSQARKPNQVRCDTLLLLPLQTLQTLKPHSYICMPGLLLSKDLTSDPRASAANTPGLRMA